MPEADNPQAIPLANTLCPLCGGANQCAPAGVGRFDVACWCATAVVSEEALRRVPLGAVDKACLCPRCAAGMQSPE
jgi:hypothetical protein|tara:strand:- start:1 stop:228 length:228 start_codon:yes stop_codon:yes gene_type:complete